MYTSGQRATSADAAMPTTRSRRAAARALERRLIELPADVLGLVLYQLPLAHDIAVVAPTCHALCDAAKIAASTLAPSAARGARTAP